MHLTVCSLALVISLCTCVSSDWLQLTLKVTFIFIILTSCFLILSLPGLSPMILGAENGSSFKVKEYVEEDLPEILKNFFC